MLADAPVNARAYGATGDGTTDDTATLNLALAAAAGKSFYLPAGTYLVSTTLTCTGGDRHVYGDGDASVLKLKAGSNLVLNRILYFDTCASASVHDLKFDGNAANNSGGTSQALCEAISTPIVKFSRLTAISSDTDGISVRNAAVGYIEGCHIEGAALTGSKLTAVTYARAVNNTYKDCRRAVAVEDVDCRDVLMANNTIIGDGGTVSVYGLTVATDYTGLETSERVVITGNVISGCGAAAGSEGAGVSITSDNATRAEAEISVTGNVIYDCRDGVTIRALCLRQSRLARWCWRWGSRRCGWGEGDHHPPTRRPRLPHRDSHHRQPDVRPRDLAQTSRRRSPRHDGRRPARHPRHRQRKRRDHDRRRALEPRRVPLGWRRDDGRRDGAG